MFVPCINSITFLLVQTDAHNYKIIEILKQLKFRLSLRHVSLHAGTIFRELYRKRQLPEDGSIVFGVIK